MTEKLTPPRYKRFNVTCFTPEMLARLDAAVEKDGGGAAHPTRSSRGSFLLKLFMAHLEGGGKKRKPPAKKKVKAKAAAYPDPDHPGWERFEFYWSASAKKGAKKKAWLAWKKYWPKGLSEAIEDGRFLQVWNAAVEGPGGWIEKYQAQTPEYIPHLSTWLNEEPWTEAEEEPEPDPATAELEEKKAELRTLAARFLALNLPAGQTAGSYLNQMAAGVSEATLQDVEDIFLHEVMVWMRDGHDTRAVKMRGELLGLVRHRFVALEVGVPEPEDFPGLLTLANQNQQIKEITRNCLRSLLQEGYGVPDLTGGE